VKDSPIEYASIAPEDVSKDIKVLGEQIATEGMIKAYPPACECYPAFRAALNREDYKAMEQHEAAVEFHLRRITLNAARASAKAGDWVFAAGRVYHLKNTIPSFWRELVFEQLDKLLM
jgi:hypothetical protein